MLRTFHLLYLSVYRRNNLSATHAQLIAVHREIIGFGLCYSSPCLLRKALGVAPQLCATISDRRNNSNGQPI